MRCASDSPRKGGGNRVKAGEDIDGAIDALCTTLYIAGMIKVLPWAQPLYKLNPKSRKTAKFRAIATKLFEERYKNGNSRSEKDVFYHLVRSAAGSLNGELTRRQLGEGDSKAGAPKHSKSELAADSALVIACVRCHALRLCLT
jgi:hypothetical protein